MNKLRYWRHERRLSQYELEAASQVPRWLIQLVESGVRAPTESQKLAIAEALGITSEKLFPVPTVDISGRNDNS